MTSLEAKIVVLGSAGVGKTSLVHRFIHSSFNPSPRQSTVGASFLTKRIQDLDSGITVRLQIWDTAGQERFRSISKLYYRGANACILCYDITSEESFREMGRWMNDLRRELGDGIVLHVVGTKADIVEADPVKREVPFERCIAYVAENLYPEMSSTPPATATPGGAGQAHNEPAYRHFLANLAASGALDGARSPSSKRSSGFWGQDIGWDCCHEISAESGEGVEEVFRVVTRKLVEQARRAAEGASSAGSVAATPGPTPGMEREGYFEGANARGSFRVGRGDRRSWFGGYQPFAPFPPTPAPGGIPVAEVLESDSAAVRAKGGKGKCC